MLQFYFLSILLNLLAGLIFIYARQDEGAGAFGSEYEEAAPFGDDAPFFDDDLSEKNPAGTGRTAGLASLAAGGGHSLVSHRPHEAAFPDSV